MKTYKINEEYFCFINKNNYKLLINFENHKFMIFKELEELTTKFDWKLLKEVEETLQNPISQLRCYLKSQLSESSKIDSNETVINLTKTIDNNLKSKTDNLKKLKDFLISLQDYYKTKIYKHKLSSNKTNNLILDNMYN